MTGRSCFEHSQPFENWQWRQKLQQPSRYESRESRTKSTWPWACLFFIFLFFCFFWTYDNLETINLYNIHYPNIAKTWFSQPPCAALGELLLTPWETVTRSLLRALPRCLLKRWMPFLRVPSSCKTRTCVVVDRTVFVHVEAIFGRLMFFIGTVLNLCVVKHPLLSFAWSKSGQVSDFVRRAVLLELSGRTLSCQQRSGVWVGSSWQKWSRRSMTWWLKVTCWTPAGRTAKSERSPTMQLGWQFWHVELWVQLLNMKL